MSRRFDALIKAETAANAQKRRANQKSRGVNFSALSVFKDKRRPIKIDFDLDPYVEEQYQKLRLHLLPNSKRAAVKVVMVAATDHGEGGTTTAAILASTLARSGNAKILLIDANLRTPALEQVFEPGQAYKLTGLSDRVLSEATLDQTIYDTDIANLFFMPCGKAVPSPSYVFDNAPISEMLSTLREKFDFVIFDGSPLERLFRFVLFSRIKWTGSSWSWKPNERKPRWSKDPQRARIGGRQYSRRRFEQKEELHSGISRTFHIGESTLSPLDRSALLHPLDSARGSRNLSFATSRIPMWLGADFMVSMSIFLQRIGLDRKLARKKVICRFNSEQYPKQCAE